MLNCEDMVERIESMEVIYDRCREILPAIRESIALHAELSASISVLSAYYSDGRWISDYDADSSGLLPPSLKRGILSEDTLWNLFSAWDSLRKEFSLALPLSERVTEDEISAIRNEAIRGLLEEGKKR